MHDKIKTAHLKSMKQALIALLKNIVIVLYIYKYFNLVIQRSF